MAFIDPIESEEQGEWIGYDENRFKSLNPVDVLLDDDSVIENVILFEGDIYDPDYDALEIKGICTIKLRCVQDLKNKTVKCYR